MSINPEFKPIEDFYKSEQKPIAVDHLPMEAYRDDPGSMLMPTNAPTLPFKEPKPKHGFFDTLGHAWSQYNEFAQAGRFVSRELEFSHPANDVVPDDFNSLDLKYLQDYPPNYWDFISEGQSPNDISARQQYVQKKINEEQEYNNGSFAGNLIGGFGGALTSPTSLIPFASSVKYASLAENVIKGTLQSLPSIALQTVAHEGFMQATEAGGNLSDFAINSLRDAAYGAAFIAGGAGLGSAFRGGKLWNTRKMANIIGDGIDVNPVLDEATGAVTGYKAQAAPGYALNAAKVDQAQTFVDTAMHQGFMFGIPGVQKLAGNSILGSPTIKGLSSKYASIRQLTDLLASHSIITKSVLEGKARADSAEDILSQFNAGSVDFNMRYRGHFMQENGIEGGYNVRNATKALKQRALKGQSTTWEDFNYKVVDATLTQEFNYSKSINAASQEYTKYTNSVYEEFQRTKGIDPEILSPRNAAGYFTQNMDTIALVKRKPEFIQVVSNEYKRQDEILYNINAQLDEATTFLKKLEEHKLSGQGDDRSLVNEIKDAKNKLRSIQSDIETKARDNEDYAILLEDRNFITMENAQKIRDLHAPINEVEKKVSEQKKVISKIKTQLSSAKSGAKKNLTKKATLRNIEKMKKLEKDLELAESKLHEHTIESETLTDELHQKALNGEIDKKLFTRDQNTIKFRNPDEWAKFRKPFANDQARIDAAEGQRNLYLNNTTEQIQQAMLGSMMPSLFANPLKKRTFLIPAKLLNDNRFIAADVPRAAASYAKTLGRHIALGKAFKDINIQEGEYGPIGLARILGEEHTKFENEIDINPKLNQEQRGKERLKNQKDFDKAKIFMKQMIDTFMGRTNASAAQLRFTRSVKNFAASTKLGGVPISQVADIGAIILKHGVWPYLREGLLPFIKTLNGYVDSELSDVQRRNSADALLSMQHLDNGYSAKYYDNGSVGDVPIATHLESALEKVGHLSGNFFGTNFIENANQRITAGIMQSKIMRQMYEFKNGTLSKTDEIGLLQYGLDPKEWADRFIKSFEGSTGWKEKNGAFQSKYWEWADDAAIARMASTIRRGVYDTIIQRGLFTSPFWSNNPILGMIFMFHGWGFSAFNRYTVPMMQRPDATKLQGIIFMLGIGAMTDPLRKLANGKKADTENDQTWFGKAFETVSNSGVLGHTTDMLQTFNKLVDGHLLPATTVRYQGWNKWSVLGPAAGISDDLASLLKVGLTGKMTASDVRKGARLVPLSGMIGLRPLLNHWIDGLGLPEKHSEARGWGE